MGKLILENMCFTFGSNEAGVHGAGAARFAMDHRGAQFGKSYGHYGNSFAIPTKDVNIETLPIDRVKDYVTGFLAYAKGHKKIRFQVTRIGCGLAGFKDSDIAPLFLEAPANCFFDLAWKEIFEGHNCSISYWGTQ